MHRAPAKCGGYGSCTNRRHCFAASARVTHCRFTPPARQCHRAARPLAARIKLMGDNEKQHAQFVLREKQRLQARERELDKREAAAGELRARNAELEGEVKAKAAQLATTAELLRKAGEVRGKSGEAGAGGAGDVRASALRGLRRRPRLVRRDYLRPCRAAPEHRSTADLAAQDARIPAARWRARAGDDVVTAAAWLALARWDGVGPDHPGAQVGRIATIP